MVAPIDYKAQIANQIKYIMELEHNRKAVTEFYNVLSKIKPKSCEVKYGMCSGDSIGFTCAFKKGGDKVPFDLFIDNVPDVEFNYGFLLGLRPEIFHFNPITYVNDSEYDFLMFKMLKNVE